MGASDFPLPLAGRGRSRRRAFTEPEEDSFIQIATRLAGLSGALLGWRPAEFWGATPAELAVILNALAPDAGQPADHDLIATLKEQFPDG